jgi:hypothetical protein
MAGSPGMGLDHWAPARAFVLDVALTDDGYKIVEAQCINASGLYAGDVQKIIIVLDNMKL